jgi:hypothetical protein
MSWIICTAVTGGAGLTGVLLTKELQVLHPYAAGRAAVPVLVFWHASHHGKALAIHNNL